MASSAAQLGAGFSNLTSGGVAAAPALALALEMELPALGGAELAPAGLPVQQVGEDGARRQVLRRRLVSSSGKPPLRVRIQPLPETKGGTRRLLSCDRMELGNPPRPGLSWISQGGNRREGEAMPSPAVRFRAHLSAAACIVGVFASVGDPGEMGH